MLVRGENLSCERGGRLVFADLNFALGDGGFLQLTGRNGAGKSSLLRLIAGLGEPAQGRLLLEGASPDVALSQYCHYVAHGDAAKTVLTVRENLLFWRDLLGDGSLDAGLASMNLTALADYPAALLSAGQKRRLALARLALVQRRIWLLDEPSVGLDDASQLLLVALMQNHLATNGLIIAATHVALGIKPHQVLHLGGTQ